MSIVQEKMYMDVDDVCAILGVSKAYAYNLMREYNKELKAKGYIVVAGKISTKFLAEKIYGIEYSCAATPQIRQTGNRLSGLAETAYASLLAQCFV